MRWGGRTLLYLFAIQPPITFVVIGVRGLVPPGPLLLTFPPPSLPPSPPLLTIWSLVTTASMHPPCTVLPSGDQAMERTRASLQGGVGVEEGRW